jgi:hypothetical protein
MARDVLGYVALHLHAHLPFVRHPEYDPLSLAMQIHNRAFGASVLGHVVK